MTFTPENAPKTDGDVRQLILETVMGIRDGSLDASQGAAMAANFKELNSTMTNSINAAKLSLLMEGSGRKFIKTLRMGQQDIGRGSNENEGGEK